MICSGVCLYDKNRHVRGRGKAARAPGCFRHRSLCSGQKLGAGRRQNLQAFVERDAARAFAARAGSFSRLCRSSPDYPDGAARALREAIGAKIGLDPARIVCGTGSDEILHLLAAAYIGPGDEGVFTQHGFLVYKIAILAAGGTPVVAPETNITANVDAILAKIGRGRKSYSSPIRTIRPAPICPSPRSSGSPTACRPCPARHRRRLCRICDAAPIIRPAWSLSRPAKMS